MINIEYISFEQAKALKKLGFPQDDRLAYNRNGKYIFALKEKTSEQYCCVPMEYVVKWFRDEKGIYIVPRPIYHQQPIDGWKHIEWENCVVDWKWNLINKYKYYQTYEEALSAGIDDVIKYMNK